MITPPLFQKVKGKLQRQFKGAPKDFIEGVKFCYATFYQLYTKTTHQNLYVKNQELEKQNEFLETELIKKKLMLKDFQKQRVDYIAEIARLKRKLNSNEKIHL